MGYEDGFDTSKYTGTQRKMIQYEIVEDYSYDKNLAIDEANQSEGSETPTKHNQNHDDADIGGDVNNSPTPEKGDVVTLDHAIRRSMLSGHQRTFTDAKSNTQQVEPGVYLNES